MAGLSMAYKRRGNMVTNTGGPIMCLDAGSRLSYPGSGTTWTDLSGNGYNGTLTNGPTYDAANAGSIVFNGANDFVAFTAGLLSGTGDFTVNQWIQSNNSGHVGTTFANYLAGNIQTFFFPSYTGLYSHPSSIYGNAAVVYTTNWCMFTALKSGTAIKVYKNASLFVTGSSSSTIGKTGAAFRLGTNTSGGEAYSGKIGTTQVFSRALSAAEVKTNFDLTRGRYGI